MGGVGFNVQQNPSELFRCLVFFPSCFLLLCCCHKLHDIVNILDFGALNRMGVAGSAVSLQEKGSKGNLDLLLPELEFGCSL